MSLCSYMSSLPSTPRWPWQAPTWERQIHCFGHDAVQPAGRASRPGRARCLPAPAPIASPAAPVPPRAGRASRRSVQSSRELQRKPGGVLS
jgi:hypothetical protein